MNKTIFKIGIVTSIAMASLILAAQSNTMPRQSSDSTHRHSTMKRDSTNWNKGGMKRDSTMRHPAGKTGPTGN